PAPAWRCRHIRSWRRRGWCAWQLVSRGWWMVDGRREKMAVNSAIHYPPSTIHRVSDARAALVFNHVQAALFLARAGPAAVALVPALRYRVGARPAAYTRVALIVERIVRHVVVEDEVPDFLLRPLQQRVDF